MPFYDAIRVGASGAVDFEVERSLRFNSGDSAKLTRTFGTNTSNTTKTASVWVKRSNLGAFRDIFSTTVSGLLENRLEFTDNDQIQFVDRNASSGSSNCLKITQRKFRDVSAWYHIVVAIDTTDSEAEDRLKLYINGVRETEFGTNINFPQNHAVQFFRSSADNYIGVNNNSSYFFDGYLAEVNFCDGQALTPSSFAETNSGTGQWVPIDTSGLTFGNNGFRLQFSDNSGTTATTLGKDTSGNGNNFTPNNFAVSDSMLDTPTNNFATMNPLNGYSGLTEGNLRFNTYNDSSGPRSAQATIAIPKSGKWYWETRYQESGTGTVTTKYFGVSQLQDKNGYVTAPYVYYDGGSGVLRNGNASDNKDGKQVWYNGTGVPAILAIAVDVDNNSVEYFHNGNSQGTIPLPTLTSLQEYFFTWANTSGGSSSSLNDTFNFGADSTFQGQVSSGGNTDANGIGDFKYAPPAGHLALCSANLSDPTILLPNKHFDTLLYSGNGSDNRDITGLNFAPDWVWLKRTDGTMSHNLGDTVRGANKVLFSDQTQAENTETDRIKAYNSDGFRLGTDSAVNFNGYNYVVWNWDAGETDGATYTVKVVSDSGNKYRFNDFGTSAVTLDLAEGGTYTFDGSDSSMSGHPFVIGTAANGSVYSTGVTYQLDGASVTYSAYTSGYSSATTRKLIITVPASAPQLYYWCSIHSGMGGAINTNTTLGSSNFAGSIQSTVKANTTAGFSVVTYTGNNVQGATVGHGLGVAPSAVIVKNRGSSYNWAVWHTGLLSAAYVLNLNLTSAQGSVPGIFNSTLPTSTVFSLGGGSQGDRFLSNEPNKDFIAYVFSEVEGYSKFGKYTGNGSSDGPFVFTGFRPALIILKNTSSAEDWAIRDIKHSGYTTMNGNPVNVGLRPNKNSGHTGGSNLGIDFLSNGFKLRGPDYDVNKSGDTYVYFAFAESPFKNSRAR